MVAWLLYAEQKLNRVVMVKNMKIALSMCEGEGGFVEAIEVERRVTELMEYEEGELIRKRVGFFKNEEGSALREGGSSMVVLAKLIETWK